MLYIQRVVTNDDVTRWDTASTNALNSWKGNGQSFGAEKWIGTSDTYDLPFRVSGNEAFRIHYLTKNSTFGSSTDLSYRLGVVSDSTVGHGLYARGGNTASTHYACRIDNSGTDPVLVGRNDQKVGIATSNLSSNTQLTIKQLLGSSSGYAIRFRDSADNEHGGIIVFSSFSIMKIGRIMPESTSVRLDLACGSGADFTAATNGTSGASGIWRFYNSVNFTYSTISNTSHFLVQMDANFVPTGGTDNFRILRIKPTIDQSAGGTGYTGGILIDPTLTNAFDFRYLSNIAADNSTKVYYIGTTVASPTYIIKGNGQIEHYNRTAPGASVADGYQQYASDIVAGNSAPHFRTEAGHIVKLYTQAFVAAPAGGGTQDAQARTAIDGIRTILINAGLMAAA